jgi:hypothetical protein
LQLGTFPVGHAQARAPPRARTSSTGITGQGTASAAAMSPIPRISYQVSLVRPRITRRIVYPARSSLPNSAGDPRRNPSRSPGRPRSRPRHRPQQATAPRAGGHRPVARPGPRPSFEHTGATPSAPQEPHPHHHHLTCAGSGPGLGLVPPHRCRIDAALTASVSHRCGCASRSRCRHEADVTDVAQATRTWRRRTSIPPSAAARRRPERDNRRRNAAGSAPHRSPSQLSPAKAAPQRLRRE